MQWHRLSIFILKYIPVIGALFMFVHCLVLLFGYEIPLSESIIGLPLIPCIVAIVWSKSFGFCSLHRYFITYVGIMTQCINMQADWSIFGNLLLYARLLMVVIGFILFIWFIKVMIKDNLKLIRRLAEKIINDIDTGNCNLSEEEIDELAEKCHEWISPKKMYSLYESAKFLEISQRTLRNYIKLGKIREPRTKQGWTEKFYYKEDLLSFKKEKDERNR